MAFDFKTLTDIFNNPKTLNLIKLGVKAITDEANKITTDIIDRRLQNLNKGQPVNNTQQEPPQQNKPTLAEEIAFVESNYPKEDVIAWKKSRGLL